MENKLVKLIVVEGVPHSVAFGLSANGTEGIKVCGRF